MTASLRIAASPNPQNLPSDCHNTVDDFKIVRMGATVSITSRVSVDEKNASGNNSLFLLRSI